MSDAFGWSYPMGAEQDPRAPWNEPTEPEVECACDRVWTRDECEDTTQLGFYEAAIDPPEGPDIDERTGKPIVPRIINVPDCPACDPANHCGPEGS